MREQTSLLTLLALLKLGAHRGIVVVSTSQLGNILGLSQQAASLHLLELEKKGMIERMKANRRVGVKLTERGIDELSLLRAELARGFGETMRNMTFAGRVFTGLREGAYYVRLPGYNRQFVKLLGYQPFPGTLNLKLSGEDVDKKRELRMSEGLAISGFEDNMRAYGGAKCFRARVDGKYEAAALAIDRTHHDDTVLELVSPHNLRQVLRLKDGDDVKVQVYLV